MRSALFLTTYATLLLLTKYVPDAVADLVGNYGVENRVTDSTSSRDGEVNVFLVVSLLTGIVAVQEYLPALTARSIERNIFSNFVFSFPYVAIIIVLVLSLDDLLLVFGLFGPVSSAKALIDNDYLVSIVLGIVIAELFLGKIELRLKERLNNKIGNCL